MYFSTESCCGKVRFLSVEMYVSVTRFPRFLFVEMYVFFCMYMCFVEIYDFATFVERYRKSAESTKFSWKSPMSVLLVLAVCFGECNGVCFEKRKRGCLALRTYEYIKAGKEIGIRGQGRQQRGRHRHRQIKVIDV